MEKIGFKTFYQWTSKEQEDFIKSYGFEIISNELLDEKPLPESILIGKIKKED